MTHEGSEVSLVTECHQESMGEALSKHLLAFKVLSPAILMEVFINQMAENIHQIKENM